MTASARDLAAAFSRSTRQRVKPVQATAASALTAGYLRTLKARGAEVGVWEIRGRVFARVLAYSRDAKLSGAETHVLGSIALHLQHMGRTKGMMTVASLADDCQVDPRTIRNALRVLEDCGFVKVRHRPSGQMTVMLDRRFGPRTPVPGDKSADKSPRRCAPRKKISTTRNSNVQPLEFLVKDECEDSAPSTARRESTASHFRLSTANGDQQLLKLGAPAAQIKSLTLHENGQLVVCYEPIGHDPPRKRAPPVASG